MTTSMRYGSSNLSQWRSYDTTRNVTPSRTRDVRSEEDPDKHNQGGHDDRRNPEEDPGGRVLNQRKHSEYQPGIYLSGTRLDAGSAARGSFTDPTPPYTGYPNMAAFNARPLVYQSPNSADLDRPSGRHYQEDKLPPPYEWPQYNQEISMIEGSARTHDRPPRHEPAPSSRSTTDRTELLTKQSGVRSGRAPKVRAPRSDTDDDEEKGDETALYFVPSGGINIEVLKFYLKQYLGRDSKVDLGVHPRDRDVVGYFVTSKFGLSALMVGDLKEDSRGWEEEKKKFSRHSSQLIYSKSNTARKRLEMGPSGCPIISDKTQDIAAKHWKDQLRH